ncbi:thiamine pyrophosphokinase [Bacillus pakistanensis]|uniref:Thiamine diphosphokinase n=1 Tax=Rossellomorea pakistanensis TaxID=992288 RepID=A0ABS2NG97_9BACI|nr:thiamine diphosphokinase [Bacillus pakistanensis]MBM7586789.1 thiamine pyrophosphokinase [Bacillus pakistanensis]
MIIHILAGGPEKNIPSLRPYDQKDVSWVGVDHGVYRLVNQGIIPIAAFGDFDSVTKKEWEDIRGHVLEINQFKPEKDETDMELAFNWAVAQNPSTIRLFGATGGRLDHFMANVQLLLRKESLHPSLKIEIIDTNNIIHIASYGEYTVEKLNDKKFISFIPLTADVENLTLKGFKYPLTNRNIPLGSTLCISNELIQSQGTFSFTNGILMVIRSQD